MRCTSCFIVASVRDRQQEVIDSRQQKPKKTTKSACLQNADRRRRIIKSIYMISVFILIAGIVRWRGYAFFNWCRSWTLRKSKKDTAIPPRYRRVLKKGRLYHTPRKSNFSKGKRRLEMQYFKTAASRRKAEQNGLVVYRQRR